MQDRSPRRKRLAHGQPRRTKRWVRRHGKSQECSNRTLRPGFPLLGLRRLGDCLRSKEVPPVAPLAVLVAPAAPDVPPFCETPPEAGVPPFCETPSEAMLASEPPSV